MNKSSYRASLNDIKQYVKLGVFADEVGISRSNLSVFLKGSEYDFMISIEKLDMLYRRISDFFNRL